MANKGIKTLEKGNVRWYFFAVFGLEIQDQNNWRDFIFGDATLVNIKQIQEYLNELRKDEESLTHVLNNETDEFCYLIIQTGGQDISEKDDLQRANQRALEIISFIFFVFLFMSNLHYGICLDQQIYNTSGSEIFILGSNKHETWITKTTAGEFRILIPESFMFSREDLINIFNKPQFRILFNSICYKKCEEISSSLINFYLIANVPLPMTQLTGSVTSIEILLKENESYDIFKQRINTLLGDNIYQYFIHNSNRYKGIIDLRNSIVHSGSICTDIDAKRAIKLAMFAIIAYSHLYDKIKYKRRICNLLDLVFRVSKDDARNHDIFGILETWKAYQLNYELIDMLSTKLIDFYGLCNVEPIKVDTIKYAIVILLYAKIRKYDDKKAYDIIDNFIYYNRNPFLSYDDFNKYYIANREIIENSASKELELFINNRHYSDFVF